MRRAIDSILAPFSEHADDNLCAFWDWFEIGGRWSGEHFTSQFNPDKLAEFRKWLVAEKVTVSGLVWGKESIEPKSQIEKIDRKWNEMFPSAFGNQPCPFFKHSGARMPMDTCKLSDINTDRINPSRVIIAGPGWNSETREHDDNVNLEAKFMLTDEFWNGVNHQKTAWDGKLSSAINQYTEKVTEYNLDWALPDGDWTLVTVDYHS